MSTVLSTIKYCNISTCCTAYRLQMGEMQIRSDLTNSRARLSDDIDRNHAYTSKAAYDVNVNRLFHRLHQQCCIPVNNSYISMLLPSSGIIKVTESLGPFYGAIAVPSVTRCRCCRCGYRFYIAIHQVSLLLHTACYSWLRFILVVVLTVATPGEWQYKIRTGGVRQLTVANGPNIFQMLLVLKPINNHS